MGRKAITPLGQGEPKLPPSTHPQTETRRPTLGDLHLLVLTFHCSLPLASYLYHFHFIGNNTKTAGTASGL